MLPRTNMPPNIPVKGEKVFHTSPRVAKQPPASRSPSSDPGHRGGNGPGRPEGDALGEGRSSSVVSDEDRRVSVAGSARVL